MVVTIDTCSGPKAYAGVVFSYHEQVTENWHRMTDEEWEDELDSTMPEEVTWMRDLVVE